MGNTSCCRKYFIKSMSTFWSTVVHTFDDLLELEHDLVPYYTLSARDNHIRHKYVYFYFKLFYTNNITLVEWLFLVNYSWYVKLFERVDISRLMILEKLTDQYLLEYMHSEQVIKVGLWLAVKFNLQISYNLGLVWRMFLNPSVEFLTEIRIEYLSLKMTTHYRLNY